MESDIPIGKVLVLNWEAQHKLTNHRWIEPKIMSH